MTVDNPSKSTQAKREQREALAKGEQQPKGRVKQCTLANDALMKSNPKERLQTLLADNKISVMGLKRCYSEGTIDESILCLLGIPFRRKSVITKEKTPKPKKEPPQIVPQVVLEVTPSDTKIKALPFVERNALHTQDNVARITRVEAGFANALVKVHQELARQDQLAEKERRMESRPSGPIVKPSAKPRTLEDQIKQQKNQSVVKLLNQSGFLDTKIQ